MTHVQLRFIPLILLIAISFTVYVVYDNSLSEKGKLNIPSMYVRAHVFEEREYLHNVSERPLDIYTRIMEIDPTDELAWHEKGRLLNKSEMCMESVLHYRQYVKEFPHSIRADEGYEIAKECKNE